MGIDSFTRGGAIQQIAGAGNERYAKTRLAQRTQAAGEREARLRVGYTDYDVALPRCGVPRCRDKNLLGNEHGAPSFPAIHHKHLHVEWMDLF